MKYMNILNILGNKYIIINNMFICFKLIIKNIISKDNINTLNIYIPNTIGIPIIDIPNNHIEMAIIELFVIDLNNELILDILEVLRVLFKVIILLVISSFIDLSNIIDRYILINTIITVIITSIFNSLFFFNSFINSPSKIYS